MKRNKLLISLSFFILLMSCNKLQINQFNNENDPNLTPLLTSNYNFQRNTFSFEEIAPPIKLIFEDSYTGIPVNSFALSDSILFFSTGRGYLFAFNTITNKILGKKKFGTSSPAPPTIYKRLLYQTYDSGDIGLVCYDVRDGDDVWEIEENLTSSSPIVVENKVYFQSNRGKLFCLNYLNGEKIWSVDLGTTGLNSLAFDADKIISTNQNGNVYALEYTSGIILWQKTLNDEIFANPVIHKNFVYVSTYKGYLHQIDFENGNIIRSKLFNTPFYYGVTLDNENIYIPFSNGELKALSQDHFMEIWSNHGEGPAASSAVVTENFVYFPTLGKYLYIFDKKTGAKLQELKFEGRLRTLPLIKNNKLIIASEDENVNIFAVAE